MFRRLLLWFLGFVFRSGLDRDLIRFSGPFYAHLRRAGYPLTGDTIFVFDTVEHKRRFLAAVLWSLRECLRERR
jgi:hypothetical protein